MRDGDRMRRIVWLGFVGLLFAIHALIVMAAPTPGERRPPAYEIDAAELGRIYAEILGD